MRVNCPPKRELDIHISKHERGGNRTSYTIAVHEGTSLRAICHSKSLAGALLALTKELENPAPQSAPGIAYPRWSDIADLVKRLANRQNDDCTAAAEYLEELHTRLHNTTGELESALERIEKLGATIEEAACKATPHGQDGCACTTIEIPSDTWFRLLGLYRGKQDGNRLYHELQLLREVAGITAETLRTVDNWLGHASTREAAMEALWRLKRIVEAAGFPIPLEHLKFRGQLIRAMEVAGVGLGSDDQLRLRQPDDKNWEPASGPLLTELLHNAVQHTV